MRRFRISLFTIYVYYESDINHPEIESIIKNQYKVVKTWFKEHKKQPQTKWIYSTSGNVLSSCMQFLPMGTAMNEGLNVKKYYYATRKYQWQKIIH